MSAAQVAIVSEPTNADRIRKTRWYGRYRDLAAKMESLSIPARTRVEVLDAVHALIDRASGYGTTVTALSAGSAASLVGFEGLAREQAGLPGTPTPEERRPAPATPTLAA